MSLPVATSSPILTSPVFKLFVIDSVGSCPKNVVNELIPAIPPVPLSTPATG